MLFQHVKIIQKIHPKSAIFLKLKTIGSHFNWKNLNERRLFETLMFMRKMLKNEVPALISKLFQTSSNDQSNLHNTMIAMIPF